MCDKRQWASTALCFHIYAQVCEWIVICRHTHPLISHLSSERMFEELTREGVVEEDQIK